VAQDNDTPTTPPRVAIIALGNVLMADDAAGPHVIAGLQARHDFPAAVDVQDLGTPGLDLHPHLNDCDLLIVVDTVRADGPAGEVRQYRRDDILRRAPGPRVSPHDPGLKEALLALDFAGGGPSEVLLVGVIPESTKGEIGLTPAVRTALPAVETAVLVELDRIGLAATPADPPRQIDTWWEQDAAGPKDKGAAS